MTRDRALEGIKIIDLTQAVYGALATQLLGDAGADVIKVEPPWGDFMRVSREGHGEDSSAWLGVNRSKRSLAIDLSREEGQAVIRQMVSSADVIMSNFRAGSMEKMGLGYEAVRKLNPGIIHVSLFAYGAKGPLARWAGGDMWAQAMGGVVATQGTKSSGPYLAGVAFADHGGAALAAFTVMAALRRRDVTGEGQEITSSLIDTVLFMQAAQVGDYLIEGRDVVKGGRGWRGSFPMGAYPASDGDVVIIHGGDDPEWETFVKMLGVEHLLGDPRYATREQRTEAKEELYPVLDEAFGKKTRAEWQQIFFQNHLRADPCLTYTELFDHPQIAANDLVLELSRPNRATALRTVGVPYTVDGERPKPEMAPPTRGQQSAEVLREYGFDEAAIRSLIDEGVVFQEGM